MKVREKEYSRIKHTLFSIILFLLASALFITLWVYIIDAVLSSEYLLGFLSKLFKNKKVLGDVIFVGSSILPLVIFCIILSLAKGNSASSKQRCNNEHCNSKRKV